MDFNSRITKVEIMIRFTLRRITHHLEVEVVDNNQVKNNKIIDTHKGNTIT